MMESKGCQVILFALFAVLIGGMILPSTCQNKNMMGQTLSTDQSPVVVKVDGQDVHLSSISDFVNKSMARFTQSGQMVPATFIPKFVYANAVEQTVIGSILLNVAQKEGVRLDDPANYQPLIDGEINGIRSNLMSSGILPPNSTDEEFDRVVKARFGRTVEEIKTSLPDDIRKALEDPARRREVQISIANSGLIRTFENKVTVTDEILKDTFIERVGKRVILQPAKNSGVDIEKKIAEIKEEIASKKITFEEAMNKYSNDTPDANKKMQDLISIVDGRTIALNEAYSPVGKLKVGEISQPLKIDGGIAIFRLDKTQSTQPADFEKEKTKLAAGLRTDLAVSMMNKATDAAKASAKLEWSIPAYKVLYEWNLLGRDAPLDAKVKLDKLKSLLGEAKASMTTEPNIGAIAAYGLADEIYAQSTGEEKKSIEPERMELLEKFLATNPDFESRIQLADFYAAQKNSSKTIEHLQAAAVSIQGEFDDNGRQKYDMLVAKLEQNIRSKLIDSSGEKLIRDSLESYRQGKIKADEFKASEEKMRREADARAEAERKKMEAESKKAEEDAKKNQPKEPVKAGK